MISTVYYLHSIRDCYIIQTVHSILFSHLQVVVLEEEEEDEGEGEEGDLEVEEEGDESGGA